MGPFSYTLFTTREPSPATNEQEIEQLPLLPWPADSEWQTSWGLTFSHNGLISPYLGVNFRNSELVSRGFRIGRISRSVPWACFSFSFEAHLLFIISANCFETELLALYSLVWRRANLASSSLPSLEQESCVLAGIVVPLPVSWISLWSAPLFRRVDSFIYLFIYLLFIAFFIGSFTNYID